MTCVWTLPDGVLPFTDTRTQCFDGLVYSKKCFGLDGKHEWKTEECRCCSASM